MIYSIVGALSPPTGPESEPEFTHIIRYPNY